jgi:hypothetical protein
MGLIRREVALIHNVKELSPYITGCSYNCHAQSHLLVSFKKIVRPYVTGFIAAQLNGPVEKNLLNTI